MQPVRLRIVRALREPLSASALARLFALPRQQLNYHVRDLEKVGLVALVEERRKGNCIERMFEATAKDFIISPASLGEAVPIPADRFSAAYLVAAATRLIREVAQIASRAGEAGKSMASLTRGGGTHFRIRFGWLSTKPMPASDRTAAI